MAKNIVEKLVGGFLIVGTGISAIYSALAGPSEKEIINWMGKESYNAISAKEGKKKANEIFKLVKKGEIDPDEYAGLRKRQFKHIKPEDWRDFEDDC